METIWSTDQPTYRQTNICKTIYPIFFEEGHKNIVYSSGGRCLHIYKKETCWYCNQKKKLTSKCITINYLFFIWPLKYMYLFVSIRYAAYTLHKVIIYTWKQGRIIQSIDRYKNKEPHTSTSGSNSLRQSVRV